MPPKIKSVAPAPSAAGSTTVDVATPETALVTVTLDPIEGTPLHWRIGTFAQPPLDIAVDPHDGHFLRIELWIEGVHIHATSADPVEPPPAVSRVCVETEPWGDSDFIDEMHEIVFLRRHDRLVAYFGDSPPDGAVRVSASAVVFSAGTSICGVEIGPLGVEAWRRIDSAATR